MPEITHRKKRLSSFKLIVLGFAGLLPLQFSFYYRECFGYL